MNDQLDTEQKEAEARKAELKAHKPEDLTTEVKLRQAIMERDLARNERVFQKRKIPRVATGLRCYPGATPDPYPGD